jgi:hypothetical protein
LSATRQSPHLLRHSAARCFRADFPSNGRSEQLLAAHDRAASATGVCLRCGDVHTGRYPKCRCGRQLSAIVECHLPARFGPNSAERRTLAGTSCAPCTCRGYPRANQCPSFSPLDFTTQRAPDTRSVIVGSSRLVMHGLKNDPPGMARCHRTCGCDEHAPGSSGRG